MARALDPPRRAHPAARQGHELLVDGPAGPRGPLLRDLLRPRPGVRRRRRSGDRRRPLRRDLEPGLHAVRGRRRAVEDRLHHSGRAAPQEHRHGHGPGARRVHQAGRAEHVRDRSGAPGARSRGRDRGQDVRRGSRRRRAAESHRRSRAQRPHAHRRRRDPVERGARLHSAAPASPRHAVDAPARRGGALLRRALPRLARRHAGGVPGRRRGLRIHRARRVRGGEDLPAHPRLRHSDPRLGGRRREVGECCGAGRHRLPAARHPRIPDRAHARDRGGGRRARRRRGLHIADAGAARSCEGRREGEEGPARRSVDLQGAARAGRDPLHRVRRARARGPGARDRGRRRPGSRGARGRYRRTRALRDLAVRRVRGTGRRSGADHRRRLRSRGARCAEARRRADRAHRPRGHRHDRHRCAGGDPSRCRLPARCDAGALGHPHRARGAARRHRPERAPDRFVQQGRVPAPRLRAHRGPVGGDEERDRGDLEPRDPLRLRCGDPRDAPRRSQGARGDGALRREVRRPRARGRHRRPLVARALRRNARDEFGRDRHDQPHLREFGRFHQPARGVAGRHRGVPQLRRGARDRAAAHRGPQGAPRRARHQGAGSGRAAARRREEDRGARGGEAARASSAAARGSGAARRGARGARVARRGGLGGRHPLPRAHRSRAARLAARRRGARG